MDWKLYSFNEPFYFDKNGNPSMDHYMRFDDLDEEYKRICKKLKIEYKSLKKLENFHLKKE